MKTYVGFDISTNCTGYSVIDENRELLDYGFIDTSKGITFLDKADIFASSISGLKIHVGDKTRVAIEDVLSKFAGGRSTAKTIIALARFNGIASYILRTFFDDPPVHINVLRARNLAECKVPKNINSKEFVLSKAMEWYPQIQWPKMKTKDKLANSCFDIADSIIIARALHKNEHSEGT